MTSKGFLTTGHSNWTICSLLNRLCSENFPPFFPATHNKPFLITPERGRKDQEQKMGKGNYPMVNETQGFVTLGYSNWTICSLLSWFCAKSFPPFYPAPHNKPFLITPERARNEQSGAEKGNSPKVNETQGFPSLGHSNWTICSLLSWFWPKIVPPFLSSSPS